MAIIPVQPSPCRTCPFRKGSPYSYLADDLAASALTDGSRICHSTGSNNAINRRENGYGKLESIETRVTRIEAEITEAVKAQDGAKLAILGAALDRAKSGKPPLETEKKPRKKKTETPATTTPAEKKPRKKKGEGKPSPLPLGEAVPCECIYPGCNWKGSAIVDSACPVCSSAVVAVESEKLNERTRSKTQVA